MNLMYPIIERVPEDFLLFIGKAEFDLVKFLKWNNLIHPETDNENEIIQISDLESDFSNDEIHRRKKRILLLLFFRLKSTCNLRLWCFTHHATSSFKINIIVGFVYLLLAYSHITNLLIFYFFSYIAV